MALYIKWFRGLYGEVPFLPFKETDVHMYLDDLRARGCSPSRGSTFVGTLSFVGELLGMEGVDECTRSARIKGVSLSMFLEKRPLRQAPELWPIMVVTLELACFCEKDTYLRALAGFALCCIFGRLRVSDFNRLVHLSIFGDFAEGSLMRVKTARTKEKHCTFLPVIIPIKGFLGVNWFDAFQATRVHLGLEEFPSMESKASDRNFTVLPSEASVHMELSSKVSTEEVTNGLKTLLGKVFAESQSGCISSHSLKATVLTYVNKAGIDLTYSELLGYHLTMHKSAINYSRDALAAPIREMMKILRSIQEGSFVPCAQRSAMYPDSVNQVEVTEQLKSYCGLEFSDFAKRFLTCDPEDIFSLDNHKEMQEMWDMLCSEPSRIRAEVFEPMGHTEDFIQPIESSDSSSREDASDSEASSAESALAEISKATSSKGEHRTISQHAVLDVMFRHKRTKVLHYGHAESDNKTACGRTLSSTYSPFYGDPERAWPHCTACWGT